ncbi:16S rRNA (guanine(527)-N(7))-methyltransferase RsmG [soil metagenome]
MKIIKHYFPTINQQQEEQFSELARLLLDWNSKINVISRKDTEHINVHHLLHSLGIAKVVEFPAGTSVLDVGTGGGLPGLPLAILFPEVQFHLVDSIGKKIKVVQSITEALQLPNVRASQARAEEVKEKYDFVVSRAVTKLAHFWPWIKNSFRKPEGPNRGLYYLKGGDLQEELAEAGLKAQLFSLDVYFQEEFFETKKVVFVPAKAPV